MAQFEGCICFNSKVTAHLSKADKDIGPEGVRFRQVSLCTKIIEKFEKFQMFLDFSIFPEKMTFFEISDTNYHLRNAVLQSIFYGAAKYNLLASLSITFKNLRL